MTALEILLLWLGINLAFVIWRTCRAIAKERA